MTAPHPALAALDAAIEGIEHHEGIAARFRAARDLVAAAIADSGEVGADELTTPVVGWATVGPAGIHDYVMGASPEQATWNDLLYGARPDDELRGLVLSPPVLPQFEPPASSAVGVNDTTTRAREDDEGPQFDQQAAEEGYEPCARGQSCELQLVRPGKVQCDCDSPGTDAAVARAEAEAGETHDARERARVDFLAAQFVPHWAHLTEEARDGVRPGIAGFLQALDGVK